MIRRPPRSTLFPTRRSSDLASFSHVLIESPWHRMRSVFHSFALNALRALSFLDRKSTRLNSSHANISYAVFCLKKKKIKLTISGRVLAVLMGDLFCTLATPQ